MRSKKTERISATMCQITRERLKNYAKTKRQVENQLERLARMKNEELIPALKMGDESKRNPGASDRMANAVIRRITLLRK